VSGRLYKRRKAAGQPASKDLEIFAEALPPAFVPEDVLIVAMAAAHRTHEHVHT
jgi:hypothetical protein